MKKTPNNPAKGGILQSLLLHFLSPKMLQPENTIHMTAILPFIPDLGIPLNHIKISLNQLKITLNMDDGEKFVMITQEFEAPA